MNEEQKRAWQTYMEWRYSTTAPQTNKPNTNKEEQQ